MMSLEKFLRYHRNFAVFPEGGA